MEAPWGEGGEKLAVEAGKSQQGQKRRQEMPRLLQAPLATLGLLDIGLEMKYGNAILRSSQKHFLLFRKKWYLVGNSFRDGAKGDTGFKNFVCVYLSVSLLG